MLKRMPARQADELVAAASRFPTSDPRVEYPAWYLHRWHFLPEGYLSRRSAAGYDFIIRHVYNQGLEAPIIANVADEIDALAPNSVLEVGCGPGRLLAELADRGTPTDLVGVELSPYLLERAQKRTAGERIRLVHANGLQLPSDEGAFDAAISSHYIGHLPARLRKAAIAEMARVVRPGGHVLAVEHRWHPWPATGALKLVRRARQTFGFIALSVFERTDEPAGATP
ncbi:MAG: class I SAM-dependent methyltransferase [Dehalococcoidia bacterium]